MLVCADNLLELVEPGCIRPNALLDMFSVVLELRIYYYCTSTYSFSFSSISSLSRSLSKSLFFSTFNCAQLF